MSSDLFLELRDKSGRLINTLGELGKLGREYALAEQHYRVELAKEIMKLRLEGIPVTIINDLAKGNENIARLKTQRDIAETMYKKQTEAINVYKLEIKIIEAQVQREWKA